MTTAPIRCSEEQPRVIDGRETFYLLNRQCALCPHACLEFHWACICCQRMDRYEAACSGAQEEARIYGPLLPPHLPVHVAGSLAEAFDLLGPAR
jgi:hypothetical protein